MDHPRDRAGDDAGEHLAKVDHADAYAMLLREQPARNGRPLAPSTVQRKLSACFSFYRYAAETRVLTESPFLAVTRPSRRPSPRLPD
jgi:site-specific recombinase XerD